MYSTRTVEGARTESNVHIVPHSAASSSRLPANPDGEVVLHTDGKPNGERSDSKRISTFPWKFGSRHHL